MISYASWKRHLMATYGMVAPVFKVTFLPRDILAIDEK